METREDRSPVRDFQGLGTWKAKAEHWIQLASPLSLKSYPIVTPPYVSLHMRSGNRSLPCRVMEPGRYTGNASGGCCVLQQAGITFMGKRKRKWNSLVEIFVGGVARNK